MLRMPFHFSSEQAILIENYFPMESAVPTVLDDVTCNGDETNIGLCELGRTLSNTTCPPKDFVAIRCAPAGIAFIFTHASCSKATT